MTMRRYRQGFAFARWFFLLLLIVGARSTARAGSAPVPAVNGRPRASLDKPQAAFNAGGLTTCWDVIGRWWLLAGRCGYRLSLQIILLSVVYLSSLRGF